MMRLNALSWWDRRGQTARPGVKRKLGFESLEQRWVPTLGAETDMIGLPVYGSASASSGNGNTVVVDMTYAGVNSKNQGYGAVLSVLEFNKAGQRIAGNHITESYSTTPTLAAPTVAMDGAGNVWVAYQVYSGKSIVIEGQRFNASLQPLTGNLVLAASATANVYNPSIGSDARGNMAVSYTYLPHGSSNGQVYVSRFTAAGTGEGAIRVATAPGLNQGSARLAMTPDGRFNVVYVSSSGGVGDILMNSFTAAGVSTGVGFVAIPPGGASESAPALSVDNKDNAVVSWIQTTHNGALGNAFVRRAYSNHTFGPNVQLTSGGQAYDPAVALNPISGSFVAVFAYGSTRSQMYVDEFTSAGAFGHQYRPTSTQYGNINPSVSFNDSNGYLLTYVVVAPNQTVAGEFGSLS